jgi:serine/threonine protein kinase
VDEESPQFGHYELVRRLARGGMAEIYLATERGLQGLERQVALKRILPHMAESEDFVTMFMDEARIAARLAHPNIAHIYSFGEVDEVYYLAMEFVEGLTCAKLLKLVAPKPMSIPIALRVVADVCSALHYAHEMRDSDGHPLGLVHRDVNPQNVMVSLNGVAKLLDFGVARAATQSHATRVGQVKGKIGYIAPEVFRGLPIDRRADVFAAGTMLFELLSGRKLFRREIEAATIHAILNDHAPPLAGFEGTPEEVDPIIARATAKEPGDRYPTALAMQLDIEQLIARRANVATPFVVGQFVRESMDAVAKLEASEDGSFPPSSSSAVRAAGSGGSASSVSDSGLGSVSHPRAAEPAVQESASMRQASAVSAASAALRGYSVPPPPSSLGGFIVPPPAQPSTAPVPARGRIPSPPAPVADVVGLSIARDAVAAPAAADGLEGFDVTFDGWDLPPRVAVGAEPGLPATYEGHFGPPPGAPLPVPEPGEFEDAPTRVAPRPEGIGVDVDDATAQIDVSEAVEVHGQHRHLEAVGADERNDATRRTDVDRPVEAAEAHALAPGVSAPAADVADPTKKLDLGPTYDGDEPPRELLGAELTAEKLASRDLLVPAVPGPPPFADTSAAAPRDDLDDEPIALPRRSGFVILLALLFVFAVGVLVAVALILRSGAGPGSSADGTQASIGAPAAASIDAGARPSPPAEVSGAPPSSTRRGPDAGAVALNPAGIEAPGRTPLGSPPATGAHAATKTAPPAQPVRPPDGAAPRKAQNGQLFLHTSPYSTVRVGGRSLGTTPIVGASLPPGTHQLLLTDPAGKVHRRQVKIRSGAATKMSLKLR